MSPFWMLLTYCVLIVLASLAGGVVPVLVKLTHARIQIVVSLVSGFMLGVGFFHLLTHALLEWPVVDKVALWVVLGFLVMFLIERFFCFHHHDVPDPAAEPEHAGDDHTHPHGHHDHEHAAQHDHKLTWSGAAVGLVLHSVIAGIALAASVDAGAHHDAAAWAGLPVFLVIFLHKPLDSMTLITLMSVGRWNTGWRHLINVLFALAIPASVVLYSQLGVGGGGDGHASHEMVGLVLAFAAGAFICIASSDLLPELQFHRHDRVKLSLALIAGIALAWTIAHFESKIHDHDALQKERQSEHIHDDGTEHERSHTDD